MQTELTRSNNDLAHQIATLQRLLGEASIPGELSGYRAEVESVCERLRRQVRRNLKDLSYNHPDTFEYVLRQTQRVMNELEILNVLYVGPLLRSRPEDRLALRILRWLHDEHPQAAQRAFALSDGQFAIYPARELPALYYLPCSRQRTLLYLPLLFHEFGHLLYAIHRSELDDLVKEFQEMVANVLAPMTVRRGPLSEQKDDFRDRVVLAYYEWCQEFYCDAVGLTIGGPGFLHAFASYFRVQGMREFYVPRSDLVERNHPVGWLRVRLLADRAEMMGFRDDATREHEAWRQTADLMHAVEDYEGTWSEDLFRPLQKTIDDMIVETSPRELKTSESEPMSESLNGLTPAALLNLAWAKFESDASTYSTFEAEAIEHLQGVS